MATVTASNHSSAFEDAPYPITADDFTAMIDRGVFPDDRRVFLWDGRLFEKMAKSKPHAVVQDMFSQAIARRLPPGMFIGHEHPVQLDATHLPLPDVMVARGRGFDFYEDRHPDGRDVLLVIEVAVTSLAEDLGDRLDRYSRTLPLATYIVADIPNRRLLVHTGPKGDGGYDSCEIVGPGQSVVIRLGDVALEPIPYDEVMR
ncbi:MAG: Uma2 family endonuclease [Isosphaeraceae bacterium]